MTTVRTISLNNIYTTWSSRDPSDDYLYSYPSGLKRIIVRGNSKRRLEPQVIKIQTNTFTAINRNLVELYGTVDFQEL